MVEQAFRRAEEDPTLGGDSLEQLRRGQQNVDEACEKNRFLAGCLLRVDLYEPIQ